MLLPVLVVVLMLCLAGIGCLTTQLRCADAAREGARLAGRGDMSAGREAAAQIAPDGASISIEFRGDFVHVTVSAQPYSGVLPGVTMAATAVAANEELASTAFLGGAPR
ncbi:pilus assembly protein [Nakamurella antarctica]|uniref:Pilus assembly protein n=2 Tax=Nakamurella antarctica TaxID=1902245 RepID=A0A3G8ZRA6_9ACTN|nr:pilus assembly protein [Nakamurella antarctica]